MPTGSFPGSRFRSPASTASYAALPTARSTRTQSRRSSRRCVPKSPTSPRVTTASLLEDKGTTLALHYRRVPHLASHVHRMVRAHVAEAGDASWRLQPGKAMVEIGPTGRDKGTAIQEYMAEPPFRGRMPVFVGDDRSDEQGFAAVEDLGGVAIKVGPGRTLARYRLRDVAAVCRWLGAAVAPAARPTRGRAMMHVDRGRQRGLRRTGRAGVGRIFRMSPSQVLGDM